MKVYIVTREGVYNQGIVGVFSSEELAGEAIVEAKVEEPDNYHSFEVSVYILDERVVLEQIK